VTRLGEARRQVNSILIVLVNRTGCGGPGGLLWTHPWSFMDMPTYEFKRSHCGHDFEVTSSIAERD